MESAEGIWSVQRGRSKPRPVIGIEVKSSVEGEEPTWENIVIALRKILAELTRNGSRKRLHELLSDEYHHEM
jgi:hypothetical protein